MKPLQTPGAFSWSELMTSDPEAASTFYQNVFGWSLESMQMPEGKYLIGSLNRQPVAGMTYRPVPEMPVAWNYYVTTADVDATVQKAVSVGAKILMEPFDLSVGRMAVVQDPQGALFNVITYADDEHGADQPEYEAAFGTHGAFSWFELRTPDIKAATEFYVGLFGWSVKTMQMAMGEYNVFTVGGADMGGIFGVSANDMPTHWASYVTVSDADEFALTVNRHGGKVNYGPADIPNVGRFVMFEDPQGGKLEAITYAMPG